MNAKNFPQEKLWAKDMGCPAFNRTLSRDRMRLIKKFLRFDHRGQRRGNLEVDKFALISTVLNRFVDNSQKSYRPDGGRIALPNQGEMSIYTIYGKQTTQVRDQILDPC